ncbi:hypothetical protein OJF2_02360 [Aquisphaera giovannonii]|uniref:VPDSG-CTERM protein sorting domain-containing protein n=1 Tax=Aquisphaera giovannonii TaxID=406548 RepID=A0A5B9VVA2_9BACT|nr:hypothetical protein [Aquisphaera giovannonii]QEH31771.1 hypothetical protein OJF2_02360 [Aquisphaera giovannonii]
MLGHRGGTRRWNTESLRRLGFAAGLAICLSASAAAHASARGGPEGGKNQTPEIDSASAAGALTVLTGGFLIVADRIRKARSRREP